MIENRDAAYLCRTDRVCSEADGVVIPLNDVDFFAAQFPDDGLNSRSLHSDAGADRIDVLFARCHCNLRALTRFARNALDLHSPVVNFGDLGLEQMLDE